MCAPVLTFAPRRLHSSHWAAACFFLLLIYLNASSHHYVWLPPFECSVGWYTCDVIYLTCSYFGEHINQTYLAIIYLTLRINMDLFPVLSCFLLHSQNHHIKTLVDAFLTQSTPRSGFVGTKVCLLGATKMLCVQNPGGAWTPKPQVLSSTLGSTAHIGWR